MNHVVVEYHLLEMNQRDVGCQSRRINHLEGQYQLRRVNHGSEKYQINRMNQACR